MEEVTEWDELPAKELARSFNALLVGGNGLASALIGLFGPNIFAEWTSYHEAEKEIQHRLGEHWYPAYEIWQCWFGMMRERERLRALLPVEEVTS